MKDNQIHNIVRQYTIGDGEHIVIDYKKSFGSHIVDARTSNKYLDCSSQYGSQPLGWNDWELKENMRHVDAVHKIANSDFYTDTYANFLATFSEIAPDFDHFFFIEGGTLAVENALKTAFDWKAQTLNLSEDQVNKLDVVHLQQAFHGRSGYALSITNTTPNKTVRFPKFPWTRVLNPKIHFPMHLSDIEEQEVKSITQIIKALQSGNVAAIILETIQGEGGDNHFRPQYFAELRQIADDWDTLLILDEVQTGVGITGKMWAYKHFGIVPDMICFGKKAQTCGFAATNRIDEINNVFRESSRINSTWGGNIVDMYRFTHIARIIRDRNLVTNAAIVGKYFLEQLRKISHIHNTRGLGLFLAFDLENTQQRDKMLAKLRETMSILPCGEKSIRIRPHLTFSMKDVDEAICYIESAR